MINIIYKYKILYIYYLILCIYYIILYIYIVLDIILYIILYILYYIYIFTLFYSIYDNIYIYMLYIYIVTMSKINDCSCHHCLPFFVPLNVDKTYAKIREPSWSRSVD